MKYLWYILAAAVLLLALGLFFQVGEINTEGNTRYSAEEIIEVSGLKPGGSLFIFDKAGAEQRVLEKFSFIEKVEIKRVLPDRLLISVTESVPLARITLSDGRAALIDRSGKIVDISANSTEGMEVRGITSVTCSAGEYYTAVSPAEAEALDYALEIIELLQINELMEHVTRLEASVLNPAFGFDDDFMVELGKRERTADKIRLFKLHLPYYERGDRATIDLSIPGETHYIPD